MEDSVNIAGMMFRANVDVGLSITYADGGAREVCGYTPHELVETGHISLPDLIQPEEREKVRKTIQEGLDNKRSFIIYTGLHVKDRSKAEGIIVGSGVFNSPLSLSGLEGYIIRIFSHHVPECETGLLSQETCLQLLSHTGELVALLNSDGQISYITPSVTGILGYEPGAITGLLFTHLLPDEEHKRFEEFKARAYSGGGSTAKFHVNLPEGQVKTLLIRLFKPPGMDGMILSATKTDEQQEISHGYDNLYHDLFLRNPVPAIITTASDLRIVEMNQAASAYASSYSAPGQTGADLRESGLISPAVIEQVREGLTIAGQVDLPDDSSGPGRVRIVAREIQTGDKELIIWTINPVKETGSEPVQDTGPESRDFRHTHISLLQIVKNVMSRLYLTDTAEPEHDLRYGKILLESVLQLYEAGGGRGTGVQLCRHIRLVIGCITEDFKDDMQDIEIVISCDIEDRIREKHATILGIITGEAILNAIRHAFNPGQAGRIELSVLREEDWYIFQVQDSGRGFPESLIRTRDSSSGLAIIEDLAMELSGTMTLTNDGGAVVRVIFPALDNSEV
ncbi:MAG: nitrate/nitrite sensor protein NarQ [Euryarchaeota archaeon ADurb.Bin294]|nr:MAG: nitrate/nitrite sensor protein NarQ [Euryarchaeota archaeon ADurb.Bin294]